MEKPLVAAMVTMFIALFPIINPPGTAFLFYAATRYGTREQRAELAKRVALYSFLIITGSLYVGAFVLQFFGISIAALRVGGGLVVMFAGFQLLNAPRGREVSHGMASGQELLDQAFYPLTLPMTTGPGTIAVTIALGAGHDRTPGTILPFVIGSFIATTLVAGAIHFCYRYADRMESALGANASDAVARLFAFILLCLGVEIFWSGLSTLVMQLPRG